MPASSDLPTHLNTGLVCVSVAIAVLASYVALDLTRRSADSVGWSRRLWIGSGGVTMGLGIWSMHFIGMLALQMDMPVSYNDPLVALSLVAAVAGASMSLAVVTRPHVSRQGIVLAGLFMGLAVAAMHYIGMASMQMAAVIHWQIVLVLVSIAIGIIASLTALWILVRISLSSEGFGFARRATAAILLGIGVAGLHYTGMAASSFTPAMSAGSPHTGLSTNALVVVLGLGAVVMFAVLIYGSVFDQRRAAQAFDLMTISNLARELCRPGDTGVRICLAVQELARADCVLLAQDDAGRGTRVITASAGVRPDQDPDQNRRERRSTAASHLVPAEVVTALESSGEIEFGLHSLPTNATVLYEEVTIDDRQIAVLATLWFDSNRRVSERTTTIVKMLAAEGAVAIDRDTLISKLEELSRRDPLTGLLNRRALSEELEREMAAAERHQRPLSVVMLDLDRFKNYNDAHGHQAGDELLTQAAMAWTACLRDVDLIARYGGEEFVLILPNCELPDAVATADRLRDVMPEGTTCSAGVAVFDQLDTAVELIDRADRALYQAKESGRNLTCVGAAD